MLGIIRGPARQGIRSILVHPSQFPSPTNQLRSSLSSRRPPTSAFTSVRRLTTEAPASSPPPPHRPTITQKALKYTRYAGYFCLSSVFGVLAIGAGIFIHDAFTYNEKHVERVPVNPLALHPETGGPKNLPVARVQVDDEEDEECRALAAKPKLVIVGGGWGVSFFMVLLD